MEGRYLFLARLFPLHTPSSRKLLGVNIFTQGEARFGVCQGLGKDGIFYLPSLSLLEYPVFLIYALVKHKPVFHGGFKTEF